MHWDADIRCDRVAQFACRMVLVSSERKDRHREHNNEQRAHSPSSKAAVAESPRSDFHRPIRMQVCVDSTALDQATFADGASKIR